MKEILPMNLERIEEEWYLGLQYEILAWLGSTIDDGKVLIKLLKI